MTILIVEDNIDFSESLIHQFTKSGLIVFHAENGKLALEILKKEKIDFILSDVQMPIMNGFEFLVTARCEIKTKIPIFIMTGFSPYTEEQFFAAGANGFYNKPFNINEILKQIQNVA